MSAGILDSASAAPEADFCAVCQEAPGYCLCTQAPVIEVGGETMPAGRHVRLTPASTIKPRPVRWVWDQRVPAGELTLTPGKGGVGKSTFHAWMIAHLTRGTLHGIHYGTPRACMIAAAEDSWDRTVIPRLMAAGADLDAVYRVEVVQTVFGKDTLDETALSLPADIDGVEAEIRRVGAVLFSIDPLMSTIHSSLDTNKQRDMRTVLEPIAKIADRTGCVVLGNAHFNKSGSDPQTAVTGTTAFADVARAMIGFAVDRTDPDNPVCVISQIKNNLGRLDLPSFNYSIEETRIETDEGPAYIGKLRMLGESERSVTDILAQGSEGADPDKILERKAVDEWLIDYLKESDGRTALANAVIADASNAGFTENTVKKSRIRIQAISQRTGFGKQSFYTWKLPTEGATKKTVTGSTEATEGANSGNMAEDAETMDSLMDAMDATFRAQESMESMAAPMLDCAPLAGSLEQRMCTICGKPLDPALGDATTHPTCASPDTEVRPRRPLASVATPAVMPKRRPA